LATIEVSIEVAIDTDPTIPDEKPPKASGRATAELAGRILEKKGCGFVVPSPELRQALLMECARRGYAIYAKAFDVIKITDSNIVVSELDPAKHFDSLLICEVKSTNRPLSPSWSGYFFSLSTAELLIAQSLQEKFRFVFVNTTTEAYLEMGLIDIFKRARAIYPSWSIRFG
jgi:hypothetical protein